MRAGGEFVFGRILLGFIRVRKFVLSGSEYMRVECCLAFVLRIRYCWLELVAWRDCSTSEVLIIKSSAR
ncbi:hypothetical protein L1887_14478 [Cichorium endivia]|nr:hypothetical protein L1887_14478 [Cichorium endivia]